MDEVEGQNDEWEPKQNVACVVEKSKRMEVFPGIMNNDLIKSNHFAFPDFKNLDVKTESNFGQQKHTNKQQHHQQQQQQQQGNHQTQPETLLKTVSVKIPNLKDEYLPGENKNKSAADNNHLAPKVCDKTEGKVEKNEEKLCHTPKKRKHLDYSPVASPSSTKKKKVEFSLKKTSVQDGKIIATLHSPIAIFPPKD